MLGRFEEADKAHWVHTASLLALQLNQNRRKGSKSVSWQDCSPYNHDLPAYAPTPVTEKHIEKGQAWAAKFSKT